MTYSFIIRLSALTSIVTMLATASHAQQFSEPYSFDKHNRAQIAVAIKQIEDNGSGGLSGTTGSAGTTIVCGGGSATATANNTCIILNDSNGQVTTDQISDGDQSASNSQPISVNGETISGADEVLSTLKQ